jgi:hypothetical protein
MEITKKPLIIRKHKLNLIKPCLSTAKSFIPRQNFDFLRSHRLIGILPSPIDKLRAILKHDMVWLPPFECPIPVKIIEHILQSDLRDSLYSSPEEHSQLDSALRNNFALDKLVEFRSHYFEILILGLFNSIAIHSPQSFYF